MSAPERSPRPGRVSAAVRFDRLRVATRIALAWILLGSLALPALGQETPDVPSGSAKILGRVFHAQTGQAVEGAEVALYALPANAPPGLRRVLSGADGRFVFEDIDSDERTTYLVGARHQGVPYPGARVQFGPGETERTVEVQVTDATSDTALARADELRVRIDWLGGRVQVTETLALSNGGTETIVVPLEARATATPLVRWELPEAAGELTGALGVVPDGLVRDGRQLSWWGPLLPGAHEVEFAYPLPAGPGGAVLDRTLPPGLPVTVLAPHGGPELVAPGLRADESVSLLGRTYTPWRGEPDDGRLGLALRLPDARVAPDAVSLAEVRIVGELDEAAWSGREEHVLQVSGTSPVVGGEGEPLFVIPLPAAARDVRFGVRESSATLVPAPDGGLAVLGPLAAGETTLDVSYRLAASEPFVMQRDFAAHLPLLSIYFADTGRLDLRSDRLHRRRSVRTPDRTYLHLEAFEIAAGERVEVEAHRLPRSRELPQSASLLAMGLFAAAAIFFLVAPLRTPDEPDDAEAPEAGGARRERDSLYAALADLEHDHETGKVDDADYETMRADLRGRALRLLEQERRTSPPATAAPEEATTTTPADHERFCRACGTETRAGDRFCGQCGKPLGAAPSA